MYMYITTLECILVTCNMLTALHCSTCTCSLVCDVKVTHDYAFPSMKEIYWPCFLIPTSLQCLMSFICLLVDYCMFYIISLF